MLYLTHLFLTIAFKGRKYDSHFIDKETGAEPLGSKCSLLACLGLHFMNLSGCILGAQLPLYYQVLTASAAKVSGAPASGWTSP